MVFDVAIVVAWYVKHVHDPERIVRKVFEADEDVIVHNTRIAHVQHWKEVFVNRSDEENRGGEERIGKGWGREEGREGRGREGVVKAKLKPREPTPVLR